MAKVVLTLANQLSPITVRLLCLKGSTNRIVQPVDFPHNWLYYFPASISSPSHKSRFNNTRLSAQQTVLAIYPVLIGLRAMYVTCASLMPYQRNIVSSTVRNSPACQADYHYSIHFLTKGRRGLKGVSLCTYSPGEGFGKRMHYKNLYQRSLDMYLEILKSTGSKSPLTQYLSLSLILNKHILNTIPRNKAKVAAEKSME